MASPSTSALQLGSGSGFDAAGVGGNPNRAGDLPRPRARHLPHRVISAQRPVDPPPRASMPSHRTLHLRGAGRARCSAGVDRGEVVPRLGLNAAGLQRILASVLLVGSVYMLLPGRFLHFFCWFVSLIRLRCCDQSCRRFFFGLLIRGVYHEL